MNKQAQMQYSAETQMKHPFATMGLPLLGGLGDIANINRLAKHQEASLDELPPEELAALHKIMAAMRPFGGKQNLEKLPESAQLHAIKLREEMPFHLKHPFLGAMDPRMLLPAVLMMKNPVAAPVQMQAKNIQDIIAYLEEHPELVAALNAARGGTTKEGMDKTAAYFMGYARALADRGILKSAQADPHLQPGMTPAARLFRGTTNVLKNTFLRSGNPIANFGAAVGSEISGKPMGPDPVVSAGKWLGKKIWKPQNVPSLRDTGGVSTGPFPAPSTNDTRSTGFKIPGQQVTGNIMPPKAAPIPNAPVDNSGMMVRVDPRTRKPYPGQGEFDARGQWHYYVQ